MKRISTRSFTQRMGRVMLIFLSALLVGVFVLISVLMAWSPGKPEPFLDDNGHTLAGSISEKIFVNINDVEQGMFIKGKDINNPVLLYLHGGMPDYLLTQKYPTGLEEIFTVVWWEQRGSGLSYRPDLPKETMNMEQMVSDTIELTNYLRQRFGVDKIYLMGHSGGTFIGIQAVARAPELYYAYIGVAQMSYQLKSEQLAYEYMLQQFKENGDTNMSQKLEAAPVTMTGGVPDSYNLIRDIAMHKLGIGTMHDMRSVVTGIVLPSFQFREYTLGEKLNLWRAKSQSGISTLWSDMMVVDLNQEVTKLDLPIYFFEGRYDYTVNYALARDYFEKLNAPVKGFYTFENSAHSPMFEEPEKMQKILLEDVLAGTNNLSDGK
jgi:pimeloyl-ACP methyl ester carboxylesterase